MYISIACFFYKRELGSHSNGNLITFHRACATIRITTQWIIPVVAPALLLYGGNNSYARRPLYFLKLTLEMLSVYDRHIGENGVYIQKLMAINGVHVLIPPSWFVIVTVYPKKYAHGFVVLCFVVVMQSFIMNSHEVFIHIHQGCFAGTGAIVRLPQCQWSKPVGYGKISQCINTTKHSKAKTVCIFIGIYCKLAQWYRNKATRIAI